MGRTSDAADRLLAAACALMHDRGYSGIGVAEICAHADVRKGSFYHFFPSKEELTIAVVDRHWETQRPEWIRAREGDGPALNRLAVLLDGQAAAQRADKAATGTVRGCLLANLGLELSTQEARVQRRIREVFDEQTAIVAAILTQAGVPAPDETARAVLAQLEGAVLFAKLTNDPASLDDLWSQTRRLLGV
ncbi:TetR/AcrR family transcriptional regulator [Nocardia puris]|uniref:TetR family transcriptional regulator n=1 Tax=Nocardia puris TaxID=208602 RepID=A0A366D924_9NOCA|nr:TetR/AcrR family transcriptional regulator [Nocardia puris]MBF6214045.1 TetR/AcrR family transcriptional regulator [Nocardia puris]MBF6368671.1 TetR/AcrR family transcriptional regulator [Nocardia puris]MBF6461573.1 TetR/AcrR family transcriptional regulator [Nocardia puris]RBO86552.1 TetR family transcriptional regulator [Nocardia puris]